MPRLPFAPAEALRDELAEIAADRARLDNREPIHQQGADEYRATLDRWETDLRAQLAEEEGS